MRATNPPVTFHLHVLPYILHPSLPLPPLPPADKHAWYLSEVHSDSAAAMDGYVAGMRRLGAGEGIAFEFTGSIANTLPAHRAIYWAQARAESGGGAEERERVASALVDALYAAYFEHGRSPSAEDTLREALLGVGVPEGDVEGFLRDEDEGLAEVKGLVREQAGNGVDAVPYVVFEGRRRDFTLQGAKEVAEYVKVLESVIKEAK